MRSGGGVQWRGRLDVHIRRLDEVGLSGVDCSGRLSSMSSR